MGSKLAVLVDSHPISDFIGAYAASGTERQRVASEMEALHSVDNAARRRPLT